MTPTLQEGLPWPLGASLQEGGVNWAVFSEHATAIEVCLFDADDRETRLVLPGRTGALHHGLLPDVPVGQDAPIRYGLRAHGPYDPQRGHRFNPHKLLIDPLARRLSGPVVWSEALFGYDPHHPDRDLSFNATDSAPFVPRALVTAEPPPRPRIPAPPLDPRRLVIYEAHVKGATQRHARVTKARRGTFAGLAAPAMIDHLRRLGVTAVELLPVWAFADEPHLWRLGLSNYWGYNPVCFGAPHAPYGTLDDLRRLSEALHKAGIGLILDVVLNHSGEGDELGPTLSFRGLDNAAHYRLRPEDPRRYINDSACGNTLRFEHPQVLRIAMDALRRWVTDAGVDGFRFDLATTPARHNGPFDPGGPFLGALAQDPVLSRALLIAEPWDMGPGGQACGRFPAPWLEWNDTARDGLRRFWLHDGRPSEMATLLSGSSPRFGGDRPRGPKAGVSFVTAHDGFTLADLVSYAHKHNEANGENNRDGTSDNLSNNHGAEGPTQDPDIRALRARQQRNLLGSLVLGLGVPMLVAGDEIGHGQSGNNNVYCQDGPLTWLDWAAADEDLCAFVAQAVALRHSLPQLARRAFLSGAPQADDRPDVIWLRPEGGPMTPADWDTGPATFAMRLNALPDPNTPTAPDLLLILNGAWHPTAFALPGDRAWHLALSSVAPPQNDDTPTSPAPDPLPLPAVSFAALLGSMR